MLNITLILSTSYPKSVNVIVGLLRRAHFYQLSVQTKHVRSKAFKLQLRSTSLNYVQNSVKKIKFILNILYCSNFSIA